MNNCMFCHKLIVETVPGLSAKLVVLHGDEDTFILHEICASQIVELLNKVKGEKEKDEFLSGLAKKMSH